MWSQRAEQELSAVWVVYPHARRPEARGSEKRLHFKTGIVPEGPDHPGLGVRHGLQTGVLEIGGACFRDIEPETELVWDHKVNPGQGEERPQLT